MKIRTAGVVNPKRPNWQRKVLSNAIAMAGAGLQASMAMAAPCPLNVPPNLTANCTLTSGESVTVAGGSSIDVPGDDAITLTGAGTKTVTNSGLISGAFTGIEDLSSAGAVNITNNASGTIEGASAGIAFSGTSTVTLVNAGTIQGSSTTSAAGIFVDGNFTGSISNTGTISGSVTGDSESSAVAAGIAIIGDLSAGSTITNNNGTISGEASNSSGSVQAAGIFVVGDVLGTLDNGGTITATANGFDGAEAYGIFVTGSVAGTLTNDSDITAIANAEQDTATAWGIFVSNNLDGSIDNTGTITAAAESISDEAFAIGVFVETMTTGSSVTNAATGTISVTATGSSEAFVAATGIRVFSMQNGATLDNAGTINVTSTASAAFANGIYVNNMAAGSTLTNSGTITREGESGTAFGGAGIQVGFLAVGATLTNSGTINANTPLGVGTGWAIFASNSGSSEGGLPTITNTGTGVLRGNVRLQGISLSNSGLLSIPVSDLSPNTTSFVGGDYTQLGTGRFEIGAFDLTHYGQMTVAGTADLTANGRLGVIVSPGAQLVAGGVLENVLQADLLVSGGDANLSVVDDSAFWDFTAVDDGEDGIDLVIAGHTVPVLAAQSVQVANVNLDELSSIVMGRMDTRRILVDRGSHDQNLWFRPYGTTGSQDDDNGIPGYDIDTYGLVIGYDNNITEDWNAGAAFAYSNADIEAKGPLNDKIDTDFYQGAVYAYWQGADHDYIDLMAIYGTNSNDSTRDLGNGSSADGNYDGWYTRLSSAVGKGFPLSESVTLIPSASVSYTYVKEDGYNESGAGGSNLNVDSNDASSLIFGLDGQIAFSLSPGALLTAHIGAGYDALTDDTSLTSNFVGGGTPFTTEGNKPDEWLGRAGVGGEVVAGDRIEMHLNYEYEYRDDFTNNLLAFTLRWKI